MLKIHDSLTRDKREFVPILPGKVRMYVCGMTVYDYCHLGHARVMVVFDVVRRWLRASGFEVTYVRNITDIDDKIIRRAQENNEPIATLTERFIRAMDEDAAALGIEKPDAEPRATQYVAGMIDMIRELEQRGLAYEAANGDVNYSVRKFPDYGKLSGKSLDELRAGERVEVDRAKQDPLDFVLWKRAKDGEPFWDSPWGKGRPGWHIECSAMSDALLGRHFDIHGGGQDLQFPHHENEIAQSEGAHRCKFVDYWMHNGFVRVQKGEASEKMSKSLGNFFTVRDILKVYDPEVVRFFIVRAHYRSPLNYSDQHLDDARQALTRLYTALKNTDAEAGAINWDDPRAGRFRDAMDDDFNTPEAVAVLFELANDVNRTHSQADAALLKSLAAILGLLQRDPGGFLQALPAAGGPDAARIEQLIT
ncbi:MAG TPA: cysteine--tRNA ligase, partial [Burkholderiales bacterium]|nr:cysteine--tRNA ligase [Burkholderiales bacterium]